MNRHEAVAAYTDSEGARVGNAPDSGNAGDERPVQPTVPSDAPSAASTRREKPRLTYNAGIITNTIQRDRCGECGMGLCKPDEYHPHIACEAFKRTRDSREVWRELHRRIKAHDDALPGLERLLKGGADLA